MTHPLSSADISIFLPEFSKFCYIKKYSHRLHIDTQFLVLLTFFESFFDPQNTYFTIVLSCKLQRNVHDILYEAFHEISKF